MTINSTENKTLGKNLIQFPQQYTIIDTETTGLDPNWDQLLEVAAIKIENHQEICYYSELIYAKGVNSFITKLTGITTKMSSTAKPADKVLPTFFHFIGDDIVVGHNIKFDINFLNAATLRLYNNSFNNDFVDTMRLSRRLHPEERHHRLKDLAERYHIDYSHAHRALEDCRITLKVLEAMEEDVQKQYGSVDEFIRQIEIVQKSGHKLRAKNITSSTTDFDTDNPFYQKYVVITGTLSQMSRKQAMQVIADIGGLNQDNVTAKTDYLILGTSQYRQIQNKKSGKLKKAEQMILAGNDINIISENIFYSMIDPSFLK